MRAKFINESLSKITAFHVSIYPIKKFNPTPAWFTPSRELAHYYYKNIKDEHSEAYVYKVEIKGDILTFNELEEICSKIEIDVYDLVADLTANPSVKEIEYLTKNIKIYCNCDGFYMNDYDPRDNYKDVESILVFDPEKNVTIIKYIND